MGRATTQLETSRLEAAARRRGLSWESVFVASIGEVVRRWSDNDRFAVVVDDRVRRIVLPLTKTDGRFIDRAQAVAIAIRGQESINGADVIEVDITDGLSVSIESTPVTTTTTWEWTEARPPDMIEAMAGSLDRLVSRLCSDESAWDDEHFELLPDEQLARRAESNATFCPVPPVTLCDLLLEQVTTRPEATAIVALDRKITFRQLDRAADVLAERIGNCAADEPIIAIAMDKGWEQIVAVHAILRLGRGYLPVDTSQPRDRIERIIAAAGVGVLVLQPHLVQPLDGVGTTHVVCDETSLTDASPLTGRSRSAVRPDDVAYVIPTSGSTGQPKGVTIRHRAVVNHILGATKHLGLGSDDRHLATAQLHFDLSVYDIFGPLISGAAIVIPSGTSSPNPEGWLEMIGQHDVTFWAAVPALMEIVCELHESERRSALLSLRRVALAGDWIPLGLPDRIRAMAPLTAVTSFGGPTETTNWSICYEIGELDPAWSSIPYGKPMANATYQIVGPGWSDRPDWVPGEMLVAGDTCLANGYWNDPVRTAEAFVTHPRAGHRMYKTGDIGRYLPTGDIEILGRTDFQVKVRGHRIELGEIEHHLQTFPGVHRAVVMRANRSGSFPRLVAFVEGDSLADSEIKRFIRDKVPDYMVPSVIRCLSSFPLSPNGKVDRAGLAAEVSQTPSRRR